jgi:hypothetical protein
MLDLKIKWKLSVIILHLNRGLWAQTMAAPYLAQDHTGSNAKCIPEVHRYNEPVFRTTTGRAYDKCGHIKLEYHHQLRQLRVSQTFRRLHWKAMSFWQPS